MKAVLRTAEAPGGSLSHGVGDGHGTMEGWGLGAGYGDDSGQGWGISHTNNGGGAVFGLFLRSVSMTCEDARRTSRIFRCAGCVGGFECPIHGRRL